jgi:tRNA splicing endonuclease
MRLYRRRRQRQLLPVRVELTPVDIDALVKRGYLELKDRDDTSAIEQAANEFISDALCDD